MNRCGTLALLSLLLTACGGSQEAAQDPAAETVFDPLLETMDKAEQAGEIVEQRKDRLDEVLQDEGGP